MKKIFVNNDKKYWADLSTEIENYCKEHNIKHTNYFYHEKLVKEKLERKKARI